MIDDNSIALLLKNGIADLPRTMSCLSWNCHGLCNPNSAQTLQKMVRVKRPLFVFVVETFCLSNKMEEIMNLLHYDGFYSVDCVGHLGGLASLWKSAKRVDLISSSACYIDTEVKVDSVGISRLTGFYGESNRSHRAFS